MIDVRITSTTTLNEYLLYNIEIRASTNSRDVFKVSKRYSDFINFKKALELDLNESIPYSLPSKYTSLYKNNEKIAEERMSGLSDFLSGVLNDNRLRTHTTVLNFLNLPRSVFVELSTEGFKEKNKRLNTASTIEEIDSPHKWMDNLRDLKSLLQDVRSKMFSNANIVDCKKSLKSSKLRIDALQTYISKTQELGQGELQRRIDLLNQHIRDYEELSTLSIGLSAAQSKTSRRPLNQSQQQQELFKSSTSSKRTLGKPKETAFTKSLDNVELLQQQQLTMDKQDQDLEGLRSIIQRQRQIGTAINEELSIQNDLLNDLGDQVGQSDQKMSDAKRKIGRIL